MKIKWGVIGCGGIADRRTIPGLLLADNAELVAVMDTNADAAKKVAQKYGVEKYSDNIDDILSIDELDAVYIATPVFCHKEQCMAAARAKKHILVEKPIGINVAEAEEIAEFCRREGVRFGAGFMMRFHAYHQKMRELISEGRLGELVSARAQFTCWYPVIENCWRQDVKLSGGGAMMDMGIHCIDLIRYITGLEAESVTAMTGNQIFDYSVEDAGAAVFRMQNGALCYVDASFNIPDAAAVCKLEFYGTKGSICAEGTISQVEGGKVTALCVEDAGDYDAAQTRGEVRPLELSVDFGNMYQKEIEGFGRAIAENTELPVTAEDAIRSQRAIEAVYKSSRERKAISVK